MTVGIFFPTNLPKVVVHKIEDPWRHKVAAMFIEVNLLCGNKIKAKLVDGALDCWNITVKGKEITCTLKVQLHYIKNKCLEISIVPPNKHKCETVKSIAVHLLTHNTITVFASKISSMLPY